MFYPLPETKDTQEIVVGVVMEKIRGMALRKE